MPFDIDLDQKHRNAVVAVLRPILADTLVLAQKTRAAHWNLAGPHFNDLHGLFGAQYDDLDTDADRIAERIRALGGVALGSLDEICKLATLKEAAGSVKPGLDLAKTLLTDRETVIRFLRGAITVTAEKCGDEGTSNFLAELIFAHEKASWKLRSLAE